jgi:hypothetical protein
MVDVAREASFCVTNALVLARFAAADLSNVIDEIKTNTELRAESHRDVQQSAKGTNLR